MTNEEFEALVAKLEQQAIRNPQSYQTKVVLLAILGNVYIGVILLSVIALLSMMLLSVAVLKAVALKGLLVGGAFLWMLLKALWITIPAPQGKKINRHQAPELFAILDDLGNKLQAPAFHEVLLIDDFNAAVVQVPRLGMFGYYRNYLLIGLPLMKSLSKAQFTSVLAHEFGHLAKGHGRAANWIYRMRLRWSRLIDALNQNRSRGSFLFTKFFNWYAPYFNAYSFPLARASEYEADAAAVRLTSKDVTAQALTNVNVIGSYLHEKYWPDIHKQVRHVAAPNFMPFSEMKIDRLNELDQDTTGVWIKQALARQTSLADTHPSFTERLRAIGAPVQLEPPAPDDTADKLLGDSLEEISKEFDLRWQDHIGSEWKKRHEEIQQETQQLEKLDEKLQSETGLTLDEQFEHAFLTESVLLDNESGLSQLRTIQETNPDNARACFCLAARLLARDQPEGYDLMIRSKELDDSYAIHAYRYLRDYCYRTLQNDLARDWDKMLADGISVQEAAQKERNHVTLRDTFEPHGLSPEALRTLQEQLKAIPEIRGAYFLKKKVRHFPERPCYILGFSTTAWYQLFSENKRQSAITNIQKTINFSDDVMIIPVDGKNYKFGRKFWWKRGFKIL